MKKKAKQLLVAAFFGVILLTSTITIAMIGSTPSNTDNTTTTTGTPADNYPDDKRATFCGTGTAKSNRYITEFKLPTVCAQPLSITTDPSGNVWFVESNTGKLGKFDPFSRLFTEYENTKWPKSDQSMMWGIGYAPDNNIWFTDEAHDIIWKFSVLEKNFTTFKYPTSDQGDAFPQKLVIDGQQILVNDLTGNKI
ncbi:MAG TPA: lyase, partial [Nitrosopumilaceae archaeon]|nr:lyase [Nitrosopumilaceae archaeon]